MPAPFFQIDNLLSIIERLHAEREGVRVLVELANGLSSALGGGYVALASWTERTLEPGQYVSTGRDPHFDEVYLAHYPEAVPWIPILRGDGGFFEAREHFSEEQIRQTSFFREFMEPQGFAPLAVMAGHRLSTEQGPGNGWTVYGRRDFLPEEVRFMRRLDPHLATAASNQGHLLVQQHRLDHLHELMDLAPMGLIQVDQDGNLGWRNGAACRILAEADGLSIVDGQLVAHEEEAQLVLSTAFSDLLADRVRVRALPLVRSGRAPLGLLLYRRPVSPMLPQGEPIGTIAILDPDQASDLERFSEASAPILSDLYGLTHAEARLAAAIAIGDTPQTFAARTERSLETVRTQLKGVFRKLGVSRQTELVRLLGPTMLSPHQVQTTRSQQLPSG